MNQKTNNKIWTKDENLITIRIKELQNQITKLKENLRAKENELNSLKKNEQTNHF